MSDFKAINKLLPSASHMGLTEEYGNFSEAVEFWWESGHECL